MDLSTKSDLQTNSERGSNHEIDQELNEMGSEREDEWEIETRGKRWERQRLSGKEPVKANQEPMKKWKVRYELIAGSPYMKQ